MPFAMDDLADYATYKAALKREVAKVGAGKAKFHYFAAYGFDGGARPLLLVGPVTPAMLKTIAPKTKGLALGTCTRAEGKLTLAVSKGSLGTEKLAKVMQEALVPEELAVAEMDGGFQDKVKQARDKELSELKDRKVVSGLDQGVVTALEGVTGEGRGKREERAERDLKSMEELTNQKKTLLGNDRLAHAVSAHGPETDQIPRLVSGRRNDEVEEERRDKTGPGTTVTLTGNPTLPDQEVPEWTTTGKDPSPVSSKFKDYTGMMLAIEEALSQATELQSQIAKEEKRSNEKRWYELNKLPVVNDALKMLVMMRDALDDAVMAAAQITEETQEQEAERLRREVVELTKECAEATTAYTDTREKADGERQKALAAAQEMAVARHTFAELLKAIEAAKKEHGPESIQVQDLNKELPQARKDFHAKRKVYADALSAFKTGWGDDAKLPGLDESDLDESRLVRTVTSGDITGSSLSIDEGLKIKGDTVTNDEMQERFENIKTKDGLKQAAVVLDPDGKGGWDVQTAFPVDSPDEPRTLSEKGFKKMRAQERLQRATSEQQEAEKVLLDQKEVVKELIARKKALELERDQQEQILNDSDRSGEHAGAQIGYDLKVDALKQLKAEREEADELVKVLEEEVKDARKRAVEARQALEKLG